ncbi:branched-chain amino acid ABC transporter permease [Leptolyngbya sp. FACHB-261]|uniref:branched-chain amino acid ABC transporter permease n=1 Tax=Leptolyngbya sp. FACHB-261 TaxID=2692806 RepID=UPI001689CE74|nr:branched-chain amino acid ABC transporter permease [Leptolyngbya sp. FACHB-261]MBD2100791.1 branched-chain amino acid ABC transporter permease [Leptolyngbya sp. FACHB-261]
MAERALKVLRLSIALGLIAALTVLVFGGWSSSVIGWLLGAGAGLMACQRQSIPSPKVGARLGLEAGLVLGGWILLALVLQGLVLRPAAGQPALALPQLLQYALLAPVITTVAATVTGAVQGLKQYRQIATWILLALILLIFPWIDQIARTNWIATVIQIQIFVMLALGLNIVVGYAGLLDLGYAAFFAIGAYTTGFLSSPQINLQWNFWIVIWIAAAVAALAGVILGAPTLRLRGDYLAIVTLGFGEIVPVLFRNLTDIQIYEPISKILGSILGRPEMAICLVGCDKPFNLTGGEAGINPIGRPYLPIVGTFQSSNYLPWYYLILLLVVFAVFMIGRLRNSRLGRAWTAIREDELAASAMGINLVKTKLLAFAMGATFSGFAGSFYAAYISAIFPSVFDFSVSVIILCMVILGGLGNMTGVILGGIIIMGADRLYLPQLALVLKGVLSTSVLPNVANPALKDFLATSVDPIQMRLLLFGLTLVVMMIVRPEGLVPDAMRQAELHSPEPDSVPVVEDPAVEARS